MDSKKADAVIEPKRKGERESVMDSSNFVDEGQSASVNLREGVGLLVSPRL